MARALAEVGRVGEVVGLIVAGVENTAQWLAWTMWFLARQPEVEGRLLGEVEAILGGKPLAAEQFDELVEAERAIRETLRLAPPLVVIGRRALTEGEIGGVAIAADELVVVCPWLAQRDARWFADPESFHPDRWARGLAFDLPPGVYLPFGSGPRRCLGRALANTIAVTVLAAVVAAVRVQPADDAPEPAVEPWLSLRPRGGLPMAVTRRG